jgi:hypothetical protein
MCTTLRKYATYNIISKDRGERGDQNKTTYMVPKLTNQYCKYALLIRCIS